MASLTAIKVQHQTNMKNLASNFTFSPFKLFAFFPLPFLLEITCNIKTFNLELKKKKTVKVTYTGKPIQKDKKLHLTHIKILPKNSTYQQHFIDLNMMLFT